MRLAAILLWSDHPRQLDGLPQVADKRATVRFANKRSQSTYSRLLAHVAYFRIRRPPEQDS